jgi:hypothetical protein
LGLFGSDGLLKSSKFIFLHYFILFGATESYEELLNEPAYGGMKNG